MPYRVTVWLERDGEKWEEITDLTTHNDDENYVLALLIEILNDTLFEICPEDAEEELFERVVKGDRVVGWLPPNSPEDVCPVCDVRCIVCHPSVPEGAEFVKVQWRLEKIE